MKNPLLDKDFLRALDQEREREVYARVISLNFNEEPIEEITGRVTSGSINIDGNSAVRRTCNLSIVAEELNIHDYYWGMNTKFALYVGLKNNINSKYDDIIWFPQGVYLISSFNTSQAINNYSISLQGKDKMCMLNGEVGGMITSLSHDFGTVDIQQADGSYVRESLLLKDIIRSAVHTFANEPHHNIIINDLDDCGAELMEYRGDSPMYLLIDTETNEAANPRFGERQSNEPVYYYKQPGANWQKELISVSGKTIDGIQRKIHYDTCVDFMLEPVEPTLFSAAWDSADLLEPPSTQAIYKIAKIENGMTVGYRLTDLVYAGDLILSVGNPITSLLDKIKNMLGEFEYFYDLEGHFVFQRKRTYVQTSWNNIQRNEDSETFVDLLTDTSGLVYNFENSVLVTAFTNNPNLSNLKNDFSIWGARKSQTGAEIPIHLRYAVDSKPIYYTTYKGDVTYTTKTKEEVEKDIQSGMIDVSVGYQKTPNPVFVEGKQPLSEDWWDAKDWAEYYKECTGDYPKLSIGSYTERCDYIDYALYFDETYKSRNWNNIRPIAEETEGNSTDTIFTKNGIFYAAHGKCSHGYESHLLEWQAEGQQIFVYKPDLPEAVKEQEGVEIVPLGASVKYQMDWRELIYQMALDYSKYGQEDDFLLTIAQRNPREYPNGQTGYNQYYTDMLAFWRDIYNPDYIHTFEEVDITEGEYYNSGVIYWTPVQCSADTAWSATTQFLKCNGWRDYSLMNYTDIGWSNVVDKTQYYYLIPCKEGNKIMDFERRNVYYQEIKSEFMMNTDVDNTKLYWSTSAIEHPELLNFWIDFLDTRDGQLSQCSVHNIGDRPKAENDSGVKAIYFRDTPNVIFVNMTLLKKEARSKFLRAYGSEKSWEAAIASEYNLEIGSNEFLFKKSQLISDMADMRVSEIKGLRPGYTIMRINSTIENMFSISSQGKSAYDVLNGHLNNFTHCADQITITSLPIYYLQPNTRISVKDDNSGINGEYIINKLTVPLQYQGTMSISATRAVENLF